MMRRPADEVAGGVSVKSRLRSGVRIVHLKAGMSRR